MPRQHHEEVNHCCPYAFCGICTRGHSLKRRALYQTELRRLVIVKEILHSFKEHSETLFGAPHVAIVHSTAAIGPYGAMDTGGFITAFMLAATALGVGSIAQASVAAYAPMIRRHFDLPDSRLILCAISFGLPDPDHPANRFRTTRAELDEVLDLRG